MLARRSVFSEYLERQYRRYPKCPCRRARARYALIGSPAAAGREEDAVGLWNSLTEEEKAEAAAATGRSLLSSLIKKERFRDAAGVAADLSKQDEAPAVGRVTNGGFESPLSTKAESIFEWTLAPGSSPQISPTNGLKHTGSNSLVFMFGNSSNEFRGISQTVAVEPGKRYVLEFFYNADLKTRAKIVWKITAGGNGDLLAASEPFQAASGGWQNVRLNFTVPEKADGIKIGIFREGCAGTQCSISGLLWLDDIGLTAE